MLKKIVTWLCKPYRKNPKAGCGGGASVVKSKGKAGYVCKVDRGKPASGCGGGARVVKGSQRSAKQDAAARKLGKKFGKKRGKAKTSQKSKGRRYVTPKLPKRTKKTSAAVKKGLATRRRNAARQAVRDSNTRGLRAAQRTRNEKKGHVVKMRGGKRVKVAVSRLRPELQKMLGDGRSKLLLGPGPKSKSPPRSLVAKVMQFRKTKSEALKNEIQRETARLGLNPKSVWFAKAS